MASLKNKNVLIVIAIVVLVPVLAVAWWLLAPLFIDKTVEEEFRWPPTRSCPAT